MLLNVTLLWLLLMVMRMWMFSMGKMPDFLSTLLEKKKNSFLIFSSFLPIETCISYASGSNICYYSIFKADRRRASTLIL